MLRGLLSPQNLGRVCLKMLESLQNSVVNQKKSPVQWFLFPTSTMVSQECLILGGRDFNHQIILSLLNACHDLGGCPIFEHTHSTP